MSENLHLLIHRVNQIEMALSESGGELTPFVEAEIATIQSQLAERADDFAFLMERLEMAAEHWRERAKKLTALARGCETVQYRIKETIKVAMENLGTNEILGRDMRFRLVPMKSKLVINEEHLDQKYMTQVTTWVPDKVRIAELLDNGVEVEGATLEPVMALKTMAMKKGQVA